MIADEMVSAYSSGDEAWIILKGAEVLIKAGKAQENRSVIVKAASTLLEVIKQIYKYTNGVNPKVAYNEDTFIKYFLSPWIDNIFYGECFGVIWASIQLAAANSESSVDDMKKLYPAFTLYTVVNDTRFDLFVIEAKPLCNSNFLLDQRKLGYELQKMLDKLVYLQIPSPIVCGLWVDGDKYYAYTMDLEYNGIYRMIGIGNFILPTVFEDVTKAKFILATLLKLKSICDDTAEKIEVTVKARKAHQKTAQENHSPKSHWKRNGEYEYITIPKKSKR